MTTSTTPVTRRRRPRPGPFFAVHVLGRWEFGCKRGERLGAFPARGWLSAAAREAIEADERGAMARYARLRGRCCACGRELRSEFKTLGIGPECRKKFDSATLNAIARKVRDAGDLTLAPAPAVGLFATPSPVELVQPEAQRQLEVPVGGYFKAVRAVWFEWGSYAEVAAAQDKLPPGVRMYSYECRVTVDLESRPFLEFGDDDDTPEWDMHVVARFAAAPGVDPALFWEQFTLLDELDDDRGRYAEHTKWLIVCSDDTPIVRSFMSGDVPPSLTAGSKPTPVRALAVVPPVDPQPAEEPAVETQPDDGQQEWLDRLDNADAGPFFAIEGVPGVEPGFVFAVVVDGEVVGLYDGRPLPADASAALHGDTFRAMALYAFYNEACCVCGIDFTDDELDDGESLRWGAHADCRAAVNPEILHLLHDAIQAEEDALCAAGV